MSIVKYFKSLFSAKKEEAKPAPVTPAAKETKKTAVKPATTRKPRAKKETTKK